MDVVLRHKELFAVYFLNSLDNQSRNHSRDDQLELPFFRNFFLRICCKFLHQYLRCGVKAYQALGFRLHVDSVYVVTYKHTEHAMRSNQLVGRLLVCERPRLGNCSSQGRLLRTGARARYPPSPWKAAARPRRPP